MDDPMAFFYGKAPMKTVVLHKPARKSYKLSTDVASLCCASETSTLSTCVGTDYADEYLEREDQLLRESSALYRSIPGPEGGSYDQISLTTAASNVHLDEEQAKIYNTYDLSYTPRNHLSIASFQDQITIMIETNPVTIIQGPTGCGKTTQVPQFILDSCYRKKLPCNIVVTQPRRIAAMSIAKRVSEEHEWPCGTLVGFKVGLVSNTNEETRLTYCTTGVLLQRLVHQKHMNDFTHVIIDEIHERDQDMDFLLLVVRKFLRSNSRGVRVVLMSATFNVEKFSKYFSFYAGQKLISAPIIDVTKRNLFLIREFYLDDLHVVKTKLPEVKAHEPEVSKEMLQFAASLMKLMNRIDEEVDRFGSSSSTDRPTILVFLPGIHEIEELHNLLDAPMNESDKWDIVVLHSSITSEEQGRIFEAPPPGYRRIILSTNIAESSLTVPNVKYIIDFCLTKQLVTDPTTNFHSLELTWASHANCQQRAGRTGRVMDGRVYRLVPKLFYQQVLPAENPPEIARAPLENIYLRAKMLNMDKPKALLALSLDPPDLSNITRTVLNLKEAGALLDVGDDPHDGELTDMGRVMGQLPLEIHVSKLIILGHVFSVLREAIIIGASMSVKNMFSAPFKEKMQAYRAKLLWARNTNSDGIAFLNAFKAFMNFKFQNSRAKDPSSEHAWARRSFLQIRVMREVEATVNEITQRLESLGIKETRGPLKIQWNPTEFQFVLKVIIAGAFYPQYYLAHPRADERSSVKELGGLDPTKTVYLTGWPFSQPGQLYAKRFQEAFQEVLSADSSRIGVKFDHSNRVYIQFNKTEVKDQRDMPDLPGDIPVSVYQALKLKSIGNAITIPLMPADAANKMAEELGVEKDPINLYLPRPRRTPNGPAFRLRPELPPLDLTYFPIEIQRIVDPGRFWVTNKDEQTRRNLSKIKKIISAMDAKGLESFETNPKVGTVVLAPKDCTMDDKSPQLTVVYDRAVIQNLFLVTRHEYNAQVFFIDSGFVSKLRISDLRCVPVDSPLEQIPAAALQCVLSHVKPAILNTLTGQWSEGAKRVFEELITGEEKKLYAEVYSVVNSVASIYLHVYNNKSETIQVNDFLVREGYAECREEDYLSKANHNIREDVNKLSIDEKNTHTELQHSQLYLSDSYVEPPDVVDCPITVTLTGPNSPLEVKLSNLIGAGVGLSIGIDPVSVNCVLLDPTLNDPQARLVVAGSVSQGFCSGNLTLRNTTLMPNIPGLTHLLALIFAPRVELRANSMKTRNVGALCGLGHEKDSKRSLFPEHDMTLNFNVDINLDDLQNINRLRYWMSMGIFVNTDEDKDEQQIINDTIKAQTKVKESLFTLMSRKRDPIMAEVDLRHGKWCRYKDSEFIDPPNVNKFENIMIYKLHRALDLKQQDDAREGMLIHLEELKRKASMKVKDMPYEEMECLLCTQKISGILHLRTHITSSYHCMLEKQLMEANEL